MAIVDPRAPHRLPGGYTFHPHGAKKVHGRAVRWASTRPMQQARLFVGFNVKDRPGPYGIEELIAVVRDTRERQGADPGSSFITQHGIYKSRENGHVVEERGAMVLILNVDGDPAAKFEKQMIGVSRAIAMRFQQEEVILVLEEGGRVVETMGVGRRRIVDGLRA